MSGWHAGRRFCGMQAGKGAMTEIRKLAAILVADVVGIAGSPARTRSARWRGSGRCAATSSIPQSPRITAASSSAPATA